MADEQSDLSPSPPPTEADYDAILTAVMETMRGRWFLAEYAQRNRTADTSLVLEAIARVETAVREARPAAQLADAAPAERMRIDLVEMAMAIARTRSEIASIKPEGDHKGSLTEAGEELDSIVHATERATSDILAAAEQVQEIAWTLREHGIDCEACDALDRRAADIYTACSFQDLTGQRTRKVVEVLRFLEQRINAMIEIWGGTIPASETAANAAIVPHIHDAPSAEHLDQPHIDDMMPGSAPAAPQAAAPQPAPPEPATPRPAAPESAGPQPPAQESAGPQSQEPAAPQSTAPQESSSEDAPPLADATAVEPEVARAEPPIAEPSERDPPGAGPAPVHAMTAPETPPDVVAATAAPEMPGTTAVGSGPATAVVPALAAVGAAAIDVSPPEIGPVAEPVSLRRDEPEAGTSPGAGCADPAAVLERILAIIHEPIDAPADDTFDRASSGRPPATAPARGNGMIPSIGLERAADPTPSPARIASAPSAPTSIAIPFSGYGRHGTLSIADTLDDIFEMPSPVEFAATPPAGTRPLAVSEPVAGSAAPATPGPVMPAAPPDKPQPVAVSGPEPELIVKSEPVVPAAGKLEPISADRAGAPALETAERAAVPPSPRPEPVTTSPAATPVEARPPVGPTPSPASAPRPVAPTDQRPAPLRQAPATDAGSPDQLTAAKPLAAVAAAPIAEPVASPAPRIAATARPATPPPRLDVLAAFAALSDDEKIVLFS